ncbi:MAG: methionyl-tRNA formyltransferase [Candidatus Omnitrophica bacterium]|nr:methionyl-tRNA formyltransferase [Candidatus Omnitrophota bacterium]
MKIVFFGTSEFAIPALKVLLDSKHEVVAVVTQPDSKKGRALKLSVPPVKVAASSYAIPAYQPIDASSPESTEYLKGLGADLFVVVSFGQILKVNILNIPKIFAVNVHGSLLPKWRGAAPTNWAIIDGERSTGITVIKMNARMDEGDIILKEEIGIDREDTNISLSEKLSELGASALMMAINLIEAKGNGLSFTKQQPSLVTYARKLKKSDGLINWNESAVIIHNKVRGLLPWPGAYTGYKGKVLKVLKTELVDEVFPERAPGEVVTASAADGIVVKTGSGAISIRYLQPEGKKEMDSGSFLLGYRISKGYLLK